MLLFPMNLLHLKTFYILAQKGSFSRTAEELFITQPAVSIHIKSLEDYYGVGFFEKVDKKFVLTEAGKTLYHYAEKIFNLIDETNRTISDFKILKQGSIHLGASSNIGIYILPPILCEFKNRFPKINIDAFIGTTRIIEHKILNSELDIGLVEAQINSLEVIVTPWRDEKLILITSPKHPWTTLKKIKVDQLADGLFIVGERGSGTQSILVKKLPSVANNLKVFLEVGSTEAVKRIVEENLGVSIVGENTVSRELEIGTLKAIQIEGIELIKQFNIAHLKGKLLTPAIKEFINCLTDLNP